MKNKLILFAIVMSLIFFPFVTNAEEKNGLITENGEKYYYVNGVKQTGFQTIDGSNN